MNISYNWLKELVEIDVSPDQLAERLTSVGLAVEGIDQHKGDSILDIDLTSNRSDCLSHLGIAREVGAILDRPLVSANHATPPNSAQGFVTIDAPADCSRFTARVIRNVNVGPSPQWLVDRLEAIGERSINNVADVTNYVMLELGQPMHAFDLDTLTQDRLIIRRAKPGERITTLDGVPRVLDETMLAICDAEVPVAVAAIIGGLDTSITDKTSNVLLEVAYFSRSSIRSTSRRLGVRTEASQRFERGVDIQNLIRASERAADLIVEICGGTKADFVDVYPDPAESASTVSDDINAAVARLTGLDVGADEGIHILSSLGIKSGDGKTFSIPSWRHDIAIEEDLVEEIARHVGYDSIAAELPPAYHAGEYQSSETRLRGLRNTLASSGFIEAMSYSFIPVANGERFQAVPGVFSSDAEPSLVTIQDAVIDGATLMRPTQLSGLLDAARTNLNHQRRDLGLFEIGTVFGASPSEGETPIETRTLAVLLTGSERFAQRELPGRSYDFYDVSGTITASVNSLINSKVTMSGADVVHLQPGQAAQVTVDGRTVGYCGRLRDSIAALYKFKSPVFVAEINLDVLLSQSVGEARYRPLERFPAITRDLTIALSKSRPFSEIRDTAVNAGATLLSGVEFVDVFEGKEMEGDGERSLTLRFIYREPERTLSDEEVDVQHQLLVSHLNSTPS